MVGTCFQCVQKLKAISFIINKQGHYQKNLKKHVFSEICVGFYLFQSLAKDNNLCTRTDS